MLTLCPRSLQMPLLYITIAREPLPETEERRPPLRPFVRTDELHGNRFPKPNPRPAKAECCPPLRLRIVAGLRIVAARPHFDQFFTAQMANLLPAVDGIRLPLGTRINPTKHATWGGNPYPKEMREMVLQMWQNGGGGNGGFRALETAQCNQLREQRKFPHM